MNNRAAVFIDNGYVKKILSNGVHMDFMKFCKKACGDRERLRTYFYDCMPYQSEPPTEDEKVRYSRYCKFRNSIEKQPRFQMRFGKLSRSKNGDFEQKRVDILLAVELVRLSWAHQIGHAILLTGDSDFVPAVEAAKDAGVITSLYYSRKSIHDELLQAVDERYELDDTFIQSVKR